MRRRDFIALFGGAAIAWPLAAWAQTSAIPVIGLLNPGSASALAPEVEAFRRGLTEAGYVEGSNVLIEYRWADGQYDRLPALATDLVGRRVAIIAALGSSAPGRAAKAATFTIPIGFQTGGDPVEEGLVASMNRPGGNITGVSRMNVATDSKRLELLREVVPNATEMACFTNPTSPRSKSQVEQIENSARVLGINLHVNYGSYECVRVEWRPHDLRCESHGLVSPGRGLCRPYSARRQTGRSSGLAADQIRPGDQPQDCKGDRPQGAPNAPCRGQRGDRIGCFFCGA